MDSEANSAPPIQNNPPDGTFGWWILMSLFAAVAMGIMLGAGVVIAFGRLAPGESFAPAGWWIGAAGGFALLSILVAVGSLRFEPLGPPAQPRTP